MNRRFVLKGRKGKKKKKEKQPLSAVASAPPPRAFWRRSPRGAGGRGAGVGRSPQGPPKTLPARCARLVTRSCEQEADRRPIKPRLAKPWIAATTIFVYFDHSAQTLGEGEGEGMGVGKGGGRTGEGVGAGGGGGLPRNGSEKFSPPVLIIQPRRGGPGNCWSPSVRNWFYRNG